MRDDPDRGMLCVDWNDPNVPIKIKGDEVNDNYQRFEAGLYPCNYVHTRLGWDGDSIHPECVQSLEE